MIRQFRGGGIFLLLIANSISYGLAENEITPAHIFQAVEHLRQDLELIRLEMGRPEVEAPPLQIDNAAPREVFFQALTLFRKADRLAFEQTREHREEPKMPEGEIGHSHVFDVVESSQAIIREIKSTFSIPENPPLPPLRDSIAPSDVYESILAANRLINSLLMNKFSPGDVYREVSRAIAYQARLLDLPDQIHTPPHPPPYERRKTPPQVYRKMVDCFHEICEIGQMGGHDMLHLHVDEERIDSVDPGDVYDIAALLVSELAHFHSHRENARPPRKTYNPGRKLPAHVYQRVGILSAQLKIFRERVKADPDWLKHK